MERTRRPRRGKGAHERGKAADVYRDLNHHGCCHCDAIAFDTKQDDEQEGGCTPFGTNAQGHAMAAINVRCLDGVDPATLKKIPFDGRSL